MNQIIVSDITVNVVRKRIKNIFLSVFLPDGRVRDAAWASQSIIFILVPLHIISKNHVRFNVN